jgi:hypothetical protein
MRTLPVITKHQKPSHTLWLYTMAKRCKKYLNDLFKPETVEVTFKMDGDSMTYTYTKVKEKKVA